MRPADLKNEFQFVLSAWPNDRGLTNWPKPRSLRGPVPFCHLRLFFSPKRNISGVLFSWVEPLNRGIWNLFDIAFPDCGKLPFLWSYGPSFDTLLTIDSSNDCPICTAVVASLWLRILHL
jgi:hypothetical protein